MVSSNAADKKMLSTVKAKIEVIQSTGKQLQLDDSSLDSFIPVYSKVHQFICPKISDTPCFKHA